MIKNKKFALIFRLAAILFILYALMRQFGNGPLKIQGCVFNHDVPIGVYRFYIGCIDFDVAGFWALVMFREWTNTAKPSGLKGWSGTQLYGHEKPVLLIFYRRELKHDCTSGRNIDI